jgi:seryl-tRNA synthetase
MQQINLYSEILKQEQQQTGLKFATMALAALIVLFALVSAYLWWDIYTSGNKLKQTQEALNEQQNRMNALLAKQALNQPNNELIAEIEQWQNNLNETAQTLQLLDSKRSVLSKGFSYYLKALAIQPNPEVWLTSIHIDGQNEEIKLEGSTFKPQQIPQTLQQFQRKPALKGLTFGKLVMRQSEKIPGQMDFILGNLDKPEDGK